MPTRKNKKLVAVIIPFYKNNITAFEAIALEQCFNILSGHPIIAIKPRSLTLPEEASRHLFTAVKDFDDAFFESISGYNSLMLSPTFYQAFLDYEFMLIYQLDAFVFDDELAWWCTRGYDYIGAPWLRDSEHPDIVKKVKSNLRYYVHTRFNVYENGKPSKYQYENKSGNGGFSLRRVAKLYELCIANKTDIEGYLTQSGHHFNEDRFFCVEVNRKNKALNIPNYQTGVQFSFEMALPRALQLTGSRLPFGCHAWDKHLDFWRPIFKYYNYTI